LPLNVQVSSSRSHFLSRPHEQFSITRRNDIETTVLLLVIGLAVTELAVWGRRLLTLSSCRFQYGVAGLGRPARLLRDGQVMAGPVAWNADSQGLPGETELLVESSGMLQGRFLMTPAPHPRPWPGVTRSSGNTATPSRNPRPERGVSRA
jgi:hypothetical protein